MEKPTIGAPPIVIIKKKNLRGKRHKSIHFEEWKNTNLPNNLPKLCKIVFNNLCLFRQLLRLGIDQLDVESTTSTLNPRPQAASNSFKDFTLESSESTDE